MVFCLLDGIEGIIDLDVVDHLARALAVLLSFLPLSLVALLGLALLYDFPFKNLGMLFLGLLLLQLLSFKTGGYLGREVIV